MVSYCELLMQLLFLSIKISKISCMIHSSFCEGKVYIYCFVIDRSA